MNIAISIEHPAWVHQFHNIIKHYSRETDKILVLAVNKDGDLELLDRYGIEYNVMADTTGKNIFQKAFLFLRLSILYTKEMRKFIPDILIGRASPMMAVAAFLLRKPHVIFEDTEVSKFSLFFCRMFSSVIITPTSFLTELGHKQRRLPVYKELFYLHPDVFKPQESYLETCGMRTLEKYVIVRFVAWNASHDIGQEGIATKDKIDFIEKLSKHVKVYISSEAEIPDKLLKYKLPIPYERIHHAIYYATLVISEGASMASEAAVLGTYAFYLNTIVSGTNMEQQNKYKLPKILENPRTRYDTALSEAIEMLKRVELWEENKMKRQKILDDMINPNDYFVQLIGEYCKK